MTVISTFPMAVTASQLVFLFLLVGPETGKTATTVSLSGKVSHIIFKEPDKPQVLRTRRFTAEIGSNVWRITTEVTAKPLSKRASEISVEGLSFSNPQKKVHSGTDGSALSCEYVYDGTFSFQRVVRDYDQDEVHQRKAKEPGYRGHVSEQLIIGERVYPDFNTDLCMPVWLAYASDHYAQQQGGFWPELIWMGTSNLDPGSRAFRVDYRRRCSDSICVPEEIVFFNQGFSPGADKRGHLVGKPQPPNLRPSFLEAKYTVSSWREVSSRLYPAKSAIEY
ncbi:MAG: hypothetical protein IH623_02550 [Verrucomicrobia bacterium]|nr:hypothetical protein [Verrucomicrobiota bacterium]